MAVTKRSSARYRRWPFRCIELRFAAAFYFVGFARPASYWKSLLFASRSTLSLTDAQVSLTAWGGLFQAILRLTGPVLLALALLALRGRSNRTTR